MKRSIVTGLALAAMAAAYVGTQVFAQAPAGGAAAYTKVGVVNIGAVFQKYDKSKVFQEEMKNALKPYRDKAEKYKNEIIAWQKYINENKLEAGKKEEYERAILNHKRAIEDLDREARKLVGKKQEEQIVQLYNEVQAAIQSYALAQGFHIIIGMAEPPENEIKGAANISRKIQGMEMGGASMPLFVAPGLDITQAVVDNLNRQYGASSGGAVPGTTVSLPKN